MRPILGHEICGPRVAVGKLAMAGKVRTNGLFFARAAKKPPNQAVIGAQHGRNVVLHAVTRRQAMVRFVPAVSFGHRVKNCDRGAYVHRQGLLFWKSLDREARLQCVSRVPDA